MGYRRIDLFFIKEDFCKSHTYHSLYVKQMGEYFLVKILYVEDFIILARNIIQLKLLKSELDKEIEMSNLVNSITLRCEI